MSALSEQLFSTTPQRESEWLSWAKVFAIAAVVAIHTVGYNAVVEGATDHWLGRVAIYIDKAAVFSVPIFVMISGALLLDPRRYQGARTFLAKRAWRLVPAIIFWHAFYYVFRTQFLEQSVTIREFIVQAMNGRAYQALYYFWIILGLVLITPLIMPWIAQTRRRFVALAAVGLLAMPALTVVTSAARGRAEVWIETPWTWWIFYLGFYLLGWALRNVIVARWGLVVALLGILALTLFGAWAWRNPDLRSSVAGVAPTNYYAAGTALLTALVFVSMHGLMARIHPFTALVRGRAARIGRTLGDATLGVFAAHSAVIVTLITWGWPTDTGAVASAIQLIARYVVVFVGTYGIVLLGRRIPFMRRVL